MLLKVLQLLKLRHLEFIVTRCYMKQVAASATTGVAASRGESSGSGSACAGLQELLDGCGLGGSYARLVYTGDLPRFGSQGGLKHGAMAAPTRRRLQTFFAPYDRALQELLRRECRDPMGTRFSWIDRWRDEGCAARVCTTHG